MPTYRLEPKPSAAVTPEPPSDGSVATVDAWQEEPVEAKGGVAEFSYYLAAKKGVRSYGKAARVSPKAYGT